SWNLTACIRDLHARHWCQGRYPGSPPSTPRAWKQAMVRRYGQSTPIRGRPIASRKQLPSHGDSLSLNAADIVSPGRPGAASLSTDNGGYGYGLEPHHLVRCLVGGLGGM